MDSREAPSQVYIIPARLDGWGGPKIQRVLDFPACCCPAGGFLTYGKPTPPASEEAGYNNPLPIAGMLWPGSPTESGCIDRTSGPGIFSGYLGKSIEAGMARAPIVRAFVGKCYAQQRGFVEAAADQLQPDRQAIPRKAAGHRNRRMAGEVCRAIHPH